MKHLSRSTQDLLSLTREQRASACMRDFWIEYPSAVQAMESAKALLALPRGINNPGMLVIGISGAGKTAMIKRWVAQSWEANSRWAGRLIYVDMSEDTNDLNVQKRLIQEIGKACNKPHLRSVAEAQQVIREFNILGAVIDELGETEEPSIARRWKVNLLSIRGLAGERWRLNLILAGTPSFADTVKGNDQTAARFAIRCATLKPWALNENLAAFISGCARYMPLMQESPVTSDSFLEALIAFSTSPSSGSDPVAQLRAMLDLFKETCKNSVLNGKEYVDDIDLGLTYVKLGGEESEVARSADITIKK